MRSGGACKAGARKAEDEVREDSRIPEEEGWGECQGKLELTVVGRLRDKSEPKITFGSCL